MALRELLQSLQGCTVANIPATMLMIVRSVIEAFDDERAEHDRTVDAIREMVERARQEFGESVVGLRAQIQRDIDESRAAHKKEIDMLAAALEAARAGRTPVEGN